jgi:hypothetical protein
MLFLSLSLPLSLSPSLSLYLSLSLSKTNINTSCRHVRFASKNLVETTSTPSVSTSFSDSYKDWSPEDSPTMYHESQAARNNSEDRHSSTRHTVPSGSSRRESVEGFDDIQRRWSIESLSERASAIDDE